MALHGPIGITVSDGSNKVIGYWEARRTVGLDDHEQLSTYECEVRLNQDPPLTFEVEHRYSEGAISLMAKVFAKATAGEQRTCDWCGKPLPTWKRRDAVTCSSRCQLARARARRAAENGR